MAGVGTRRTSGLGAAGLKIGPDDRHAETLVLLGRKSPRFHLNPELRDDLVHLAQRAECHVEFVDESMPLAQLGGMGCLLRA